GRIRRRASRMSSAEPRANPPGDDRHREEKHSGSEEPRELVATSARHHSLPARDGPDLVAQPYSLGARGGAPVAAAGTVGVVDRAGNRDERAGRPAGERPGDVARARALRADP